jgi:hypothetical protein
MGQKRPIRHFSCMGVGWYYPLKMGQDDADCVIVFDGTEAGSYHWQMPLVKV